MTQNNLVIVAFSWPEGAVSGLSAEPTNPLPICILSIAVSHQWASFQKLTGQSGRRALMTVPVTTSALAKAGDTHQSRVCVRVRVVILGDQNVGSVLYAFEGC